MLLISSESTQCPIKWLQQKYSPFMPLLILFSCEIFSALLEAPASSLKLQIYTNHTFRI